MITYLSNRYFFGAYHVLGSVLRPGGKTVNKASKNSCPQRVHIGVGGCAPNYPFFFIRHSQRPKLLQTYLRSPLSVTSLHVLHGVGLPSADS